uniref:Uncharacterized protein n=1 Tax=Leersia perrieri TaxID=77586 RepID=A0A0D9XIY1_9ORYZ
MQQTMWEMMQHTGYTRQPQYTVFTRDYSASQRCYQVELVIPSRDDDRHHVVVYGTGWTAMAAMNDASYSATGYLCDTSPESQERIIEDLTDELNRARRRIAILDHEVQPRAEIWGIAPEVVFGDIAAPLLRPQFSIFVPEGEYVDKEGSEFVDEQFEEIVDEGKFASPLINLIL